MIEQRYWMDSTDNEVHACIGKNPDCRPVVVLDPDDAEQRQALAQEYRRLSGQHIAPAYLTETLRAMLPKPPATKPAEPQQLGAVVKDRDMKWVRVRLGSGGVWLCTYDDDRQSWVDFSDDVTIARGDQ